VSRAAFAAAGALCLLAGLLVAETKPGPKESPTDQVMCVVCGDYTFERRLATPAVYEGKRIHLCSLNELALIRKTPEKYVWATDVVTGRRVNKIHTAFTADHRVRVHKVKEKRFEVWPRRFFFESAKSRDEFRRNPQKYLKEPYAV
jgi:YHS domain-containing protein